MANSTTDRLDAFEEAVEQLYVYLHRRDQHGLGPDVPPFPSCGYEPCASWHRYLAGRGRFG